jgi:DNA-binding CsgD family transcriptional regulator
MQQEIVGRREELAAVEGLLDMQRLPAALVLEGEAGIGKTTLWRAGVERAREHGWLLLSCAPASDEVRLAFSGLADLVAPVLDDGLDRLPEPQRAALETALLLRAGSTRRAEERAISAGVLTLLRGVAAGRPTLVAIDDVQWLDGASGSVVSFALRRLGAGDGIGVLLARRTGAGVGPTLVEAALEALEPRRVEVRSLSLGALSRLVREWAGAQLPRSTLVRVHEVSGGNPFYARELSLALARHEGAISPRDPLPVPATLRGLLDDRLGALPESSLRALEVVAGLAEPSTDLVQRVTRRSAERALAPAVSAGIVSLGADHLRIRHPLLAEAILGRLAPPDRRRLHRRLAGVAPTEEERARQLALAASGPEEAVAQAIEDAGDGASRRGAARIAAELFDEAVRLTPEGPSASRHRRLLRASRAWYAALDWELAQERARAALEIAEDSHARADALLAIAPCLRDPWELEELAVNEARDDALLRARLRTIMGVRRFDRDARGALETARLAVADAEVAGDDAALAEALALLGIVETVLAEGEPRKHFEQARALEGVADVNPELAPTLGLAEHLLLRDELDEARALFHEHLERATSRGSDVVVAHLLWVLGWLEYKAGHWDLALDLGVESRERYEGSGHDVQAATTFAQRAQVTASRGDVELTRRLCEEALALSDSPRTRETAGNHLALAELGHERYVTAVQEFRENASGFVEPGYRPEVPNWIEALVGVGRLDEAEAMLVEWEELGRRLDRPRALATGARCRGFLLAARGDQQGALESLEQALVEHERLPVPFERARTLLALGAQRRRVKHRAEARHALKEALAIFEELGAVVWADRARRELSRIPGRRASDRDELTETEQRIAELVAEGRSNKEVAAALFVTVKTVEAALTRIYRKLGVRSRSELARTFPSTAKQ